MKRTPKKSPYDILLERILTGQYEPGVSLLEKEIARELGVSRTPVREALLRLKFEGLVRIIPRGGIYVSEPSLRFIREVTEVRLVLLQRMARLVVEHRTERWLDQCERWLAQAHADWQTLSMQELMGRDEEFHRLLYSAAGNEVLSEQLLMLRRYAVLFWVQSRDGLAPLDGIINDFSDILTAARNRDYESCAAVLRRHVLEHLHRIQNYMVPSLPAAASSDGGTSLA